MGADHFRPLSGNYISQSSDIDVLTFLELHFRPLSGNYISQFIINTSNHKPEQYFRPLSGNYISQSRSFYRQTSP